MPRLPPYVAAKGAALVFRRRIPASIHRPETRHRLSVALRTRCPREAGRRAAALNALAEAAWTMEVPDEQVLAILAALSAKVAGLPPMPPAAQVEAERRLGVEAHAALAGRPSRLDDPALLAEFLDEFGWPSMPAAVEVAEQLSCSINGHLDAYDDAIRRGEPPVPAMEALRARLDAPAPPRSAPRPPSPVAVEQEPAPAKASQRPAQRREQAAHDAPTSTPRPATRATLRSGDPEGFQSWSGRYLDRRREGFLCESLDETADPAVGERFVRSSLDNYQAAIRAWLDVVGNRRLRDYTHADAREFLSLMARVPAKRPRSTRQTLREAIAEADATERRRTVEAEAAGASPGAVALAKERARVPRLRMNTLERYRANLSQIFGFAVASGLRPENPFAGAGMTPKAKKAKRLGEPRVARRAWLPDELRTLFRDRPDDPAFRWAARIAVGTGIRMEAVLRLRGASFRSDGDGGWMVEVERDKTDAGRRDVPLHSVLVEAGLLRLAQEAGDGRLFPHLAPDANGRLAGPFSRDWGRYRKRRGLTARGLDFHGLRATMNAAMEARSPNGEPDASLTIRQAILGHSSDALADSAYLRDGPDWRGRRAAVEAIPLRDWGV